MTEGGGGQWKLNLRLVGEALGRTNDAEQLLTDYDAEAAQARRAIRRGAAGCRAAPRVAVAVSTDNGLRFAPRDSFAGDDPGGRRSQAGAAHWRTPTRSCSPRPRPRPAYADGDFDAVDAGALVGRRRSPGGPGGAGGPARALAGATTGAS